MLSNQRHEKFAQAIVSGLPGSRAYKEAGFTATGRAAEACASRLLSDAKVSARVSELKERAAASVSISREWVLDQLIDNVRRAKENEKLDGATANRALELLGKEIGMFVERAEQGLPGEFDELSTEQKRERAKSLASDLGLSNRSTVAGTA